MSSSHDIVMAPSSPPRSTTESPNSYYFRTHPHNIVRPRPVERLRFTIPTIPPQSRTNHHLHSTSSAAPSHRHNLPSPATPIFKLQEDLTPGSTPPTYHHHNQHQHQNRHFHHHHQQQQVQSPSTPSVSSSSPSSNHSSPSIASPASPPLSSSATQRRQQRQTHPSVTSSSSSSSRMSKTRGFNPYSSPSSNGGVGSTGTRNYAASAPHQSRTTRCPHPLCVCDRCESAALFSAKANQNSIPNNQHHHFTPSSSTSTSPTFSSSSRHGHRQNNRNDKVRLTRAGKSEPIVIPARPVEPLTSSADYQASHRKLRVRSRKQHHRHHHPNYGKPDRSSMASASTAPDHRSVNFPASLSSSSSSESD